MGTRDRKRPDESRKPSYITPEGYRRLEEEAHRLWTLERPRMAKAVAVAAAEGDRSENAEYIYGKKKLAEIDRRLAFLSARLDVLQIVDRAPVDDGTIRFGAVVMLEDESGARFRYHLVGPDETDLRPSVGAEAGSPHPVSIESPMGRALLGRGEGDEVVVPRPRGSASFAIESVTYMRGSGLDRGLLPIAARGARPVNVAPYPPRRSPPATGHLPTATVRRRGR